MRTIVINLTRFGDLLQTQPVFSDLKAAGCETALVCLENFAPAAKLLKDVDVVHPLSGAAWLAETEQGDWRKGLRGCLGELQALGNDFQPQRIINLTSSTPARLLAKLLGSSSSSSRGFLMDDHGFGVNSDPWASFLIASGKHRGCSPFNLVDLFRRAAGSGNEQRPLETAAPSQEMIAAALSRLQAAAPTAADGFIGFQLGASADYRRWPVESFARLGERAWEKFSLCPVLLGGGGEKVLGEQFSAESQAPHIDLIGATSLPELAAVLTQIQLLVTNDTGTMHLAAGLDTPIAAFFPATAQPWDTGPYRPGNLCMEPNLDCHPCAFNARCTADRVCRTMIRPEHVWPLVESKLTAGVWGFDASGSLRAWQTAFDDAGFMSLISLSDHGEGEQTQWIRLQRAVYRHFLDKEEPFGDGVLPPSGEFGREIVEALTDSRRMLTLMQARMTVLGGSASQAMKKKCVDDWRRLHRHWTGNPELGVLGELWLEETNCADRTGDALASTVASYASLVDCLLEAFARAGMRIDK